MQKAKAAAASAKETAGNVAASAKAGMDKTKAAVQEKVERVTAHDPLQKEMATQKKEEKIHQAEHNKQEAREQNAAARQGAASGGTQHYTAGGGIHHTADHGTTGSNISRVGAGHRTGNNVNDDIFGSQYPAGGNTGAGLNPMRDTDAEFSLGANTGNDFNPRSTDSVLPDDADFGTGLNPIRNANAGCGGGAPTSGHGTRGI